MEIAEYIPRGHENAVSRQYLKSILHTTDREIRSAIADSDEQIFWHNGYFRHKDENDVRYEEEYLRQEQARARAMIDKVKRIKKAIYG